jgi:hypothetical protein
MEDTYILIGLSVLFICCIYLFYLNFKNAREREFLQVQINDLKFELATRTELLQQQHAGGCDMPASVSMFMQQQHPVPVPAPAPAPAPPSIEIVDEVDVTEQPIDLAPEDIENINNLSNEATADDINLESNNLIEDLDDIELDDVDIEHFNVDDLDLDVVHTAPEASSVPLIVEIVDSGDVDGGESSDVADINLKTLTKNELLNSSVKYLKLIAKNCGVSSRGNKESLISAISKKLEL